MQHNRPLSRVGGFKRLAFTSNILEFLPFQPLQESDPTTPRRKGLNAPLDNNIFVKPIKQCFVKNPRVMPMTRIMLTLLSGWAGQGGSIETTTGIIGKHLSRCRRQVFRYLKDAVEEGYLYYNRTKDKIGRYTGIRIWLNFSAIRFTKFKRPKKNQKAAESLDVTLKSETNSKHIFIKKEDTELSQILERMASNFGFEMPKMTPE